MKFIQLKCPNCNANLEAEDTLDTIYCKYCGTRIVIADQTKELIEAKTKLKMADKELEMEQVRHRQEMEEKRYQDKQNIKYLFVRNRFRSCWFSCIRNCFLAIRASLSLTILPRACVVWSSLD